MSEEEGDYFNLDDGVVGDSEPSSADDLDAFAEDDILEDAGDITDDSMVDRDMEGPGSLDAAVRRAAEREMEGRRDIERRQRAIAGQQGAYDGLAERMARVLDEDEEEDARPHRRLLRRCV
ncbi:hypothetical protein KIPB_011241 [Kipferlia bialata]|uniref:Uncharacterized protein n=1 Tax=Kipferlia bialata TaxID=797122 RepID=A0A9K3D4V3_9EUKA|nr:hypothetical protein KIPB_011241 [Kipferlia bialata]|eukprot:g11241.t1